MNITHRIAARAETVTNVGLGLLLAAILGAETAATAARHSYWPFGLAVGLIIGVAALLRGRNPVRAATVGLIVCGVADVAGDAARLASGPGFAATAGLLVLAAAAVRVAAARTAVTVAVAGVIALVAGRLTGRPEFIVPLAFLGVLAWGGALGIGVWLRSIDARHQLAIETARRDERLELARELHDVVAHHVAGIVVQAQAARIVSAKRPETLDATLAGIELAGTDALGAMRQVVSLLRDAGDSTAANGVSHGPEQLTALVSRFADQGRAVQLRLPDQVRPPWPPEVAATVYRVVQEALTNIVLHAPAAAHVTVTVQSEDTGVSVEVTDDAPPARPVPSWFTHGGGHGLVGMRERVEALGGRLQAGSGPAGGWVIRAEVPVPAGSGR
jgi:signal transduction histidine kinase